MRSATRISAPQGRARKAMEARPWCKGRGRSCRAREGRNAKIGSKKAGPPRRTQLQQRRKNIHLGGPPQGPISRHSLRQSITSLGYGMRGILSTSSSSEGPRGSLYLPPRFFRCALPTLLPVLRRSAALIKTDEAEAKSRKRRRERMAEREGEMQGGRRQHLLSSPRRPQCRMHLPTCPSLHQRDLKTAQLCRPSAEDLRQFPSP